LPSASVLRYNILAVSLKLDEEIFKKFSRGTVKDKKLLDKKPACCGPAADISFDRARGGELSADKAGLPEWAVGYVATSAGMVLKISSDWSRSDHIGQLKCRIGSWRDDYRVEPGLYAVGEPGKASDVFVSANYKLSFDTLRRDVKGLDAWILVLDTRGINVWCAAGKGTFGTDELVKRIDSTGLSRVVEHRRIILPQLGAPGISAHEVKEGTGFRVYYGPVDSGDIRAFVAAGYEADEKMRLIKFSLYDRLVLTPMELRPALRHFPVYIAIVLIFFGLKPEGLIFWDAMANGLPFIYFGFISILAGAFFTPLLLPYIPFKAFSVKGWVVGAVSVYLSMRLFGVLADRDTTLLIITYLFFPVVSSYMAVLFTGSTVFTGMSGVKKELKYAIPVYLSSAAVSALLLIVFKLGQWRIL
jgi:hypothetical protein